MLHKLRSTYNELPPKFWTLVWVSFIDRMGGALIFPFFSLYVTEKFNVGMTEVGTLFFFFSISSFIGVLIGGALTDKFGRKALILFSLVMSAASILALGFVNDIRLFYVIGIVVGILADTGGPAHQAMVADLLPEEKRAQGFAVLRVTANLAVTFGPMIGGFLAGINYLLLFIIDAIASSITAILVVFLLPETKPEKSVDKPADSLMATFKGYFKVLGDRTYMAFIFISMIMVVVYMQMNTTLAPYLRDSHGIPPVGFGYILSMNAAMVVLFQFWITRRVEKIKPLIVIAVGTLLYAIGFAMYGFYSTFAMFLVAMVIITIGEMLNVPASQSLASSFAPEDMRGRYMAMFGFSWIIPSAIGPLAAGLVMDNIDPRWVWWGAGILGLIATVGYYWLHRKVGHKLGPPDTSPEANTGV